VYYQWLIRRPATPYWPLSTSAMQSLRNGVDGATTALPGAGIQFGGYRTSLTENRRAGLLIAPGFSRPSEAYCNRVFFCASGRSGVSNQASYYPTTSLLTPCTFLQPVNHFFFPSHASKRLARAKTDSKMLSSGDARDGASVAEHDPSPSSRVCHEGVSPGMEGAPRAQACRSVVLVHFSFFLSPLCAQQLVHQFEPSHPL